MAKKSGDYYEGVEPNPENQTRRGSLGALIGLGGKGGQAQAEAPSQAPQMGRMMQPQEDFESLRERNKTFLRDPSTQAALMTFATGMLTPVSNNGELMGLFANSLGNAARAAAGVEEAQLAQTIAERKMAMEEAELGLKAGEFDLSQRKFALEQGNAKRSDENADQTHSLAERKQGFEERKFEEELKLKGRTTNTSIVTADDPLNKQFGLGLTGKEKARVEITRGPDGKLISASVLGEFGDDGDAGPTELARLQADLKAAEDRGDTKAARELQNMINEKSLASVTNSGYVSIPDENAPGGVRQEAAQGGKAEAEAKAAADKAESERRLKQARYDALKTNLDDAVNMISNPIQFGSTKLNPDTYLTGLGSISQYIPGTPAKDLQATLTSMRSRIGFEELQRMREASSTGGALGQVSTFENIMLQNAFYSLEQGQTAGQLVRNLERFRNMLDDIVYGGQMSTIAKQIKSGDISPEDAERAANNLFGVASEGLMKMPNPETIVDTSQPPDNWTEENKLLWQYLPEPQRRGIKEGTIK